MTIIPESTADALQIDLISRIKPNQTPVNLQEMAI